MDTARWGLSCSAFDTNVIKIFAADQAKILQKALHSAALISVPGVGSSNEDGEKEPLLEKYVFARGSSDEEVRRLGETCAFYKH